MKRIPHIIVLFSFLVNTLGPAPLAWAQELRLPAPGVMVNLSPPVDPPVLKGVTIYPNDPFRFDFILDKGSSGVITGEAGLTRLVKYFLASMTTPENDLWVNLSPYEKNRIIPESFGQTDMGRDLLAEDYILKQVTASLIYPEAQIGRQFWKRVYEEAAKKFGTTNIPVNTFNKVWIVPDHAKVYEHGNTAFVVRARLKVMLEQDYLSMQKHMAARNDAASVGADIVREIVIPQLEKEVNEGSNFASLRQVYYSLILAVWFKKRMKDSILGRQYMDQNKIEGIHSNSQNDTEAIYQRYLKAFKKGVYNYIREESDPVTKGLTPRKYFSGGVVCKFGTGSIDYSKILSPDEISGLPAPSDLAQVSVNLDNAMKAKPQGANDAEKVKDILGALWPELQRMVKSRKGYGKNGEPQIIVREFDANTLRFDVFYKGMSIFEVFFTGSQLDERDEILNLIYLDPVLRGNQWGPRVLLKIIAYYKKLGKKNIKIIISDEGRAFWQGKIKLNTADHHTYPIDELRDRIKEYLKAPDSALVADRDRIKRELKAELGSTLPLDDLFFGSYVKKGNGGVSIVYEDPLDPGKRFYKVFKKGYKEFGLIELTNLKILNGIAGIPRVLKAGTLRNGQIWIQMEGIENAQSIIINDEAGNSRVSNIWSRFSFSQQCDIFARVAGILELAHQRGISISHNDINPLNIIINDHGDVMVIDWDLAALLGEEQKLGTARFKAPEYIKQDQSDVYSLARTMDFVFQGHDLGDLLQRMNNEDHPNERLTMSEVAEKLRRLALKAAEQAPGGIDLTAKRMNLDLESDGSVLKQPVNLGALENIEINGLYIRDIEVKPLNNLLTVLGLNS